MPTGPPWISRWAVGLAGLGMGLLAFFSARTPTEAFASDPIWVVTSWMIAVSLFLFMFAGGHFLRKLCASMLIVYGLSRAGAYLVQGNEVPLGVWVLVAGLTISAYKSAERTVDDPRDGGADG